MAMMQLNKIQFIGNASQFRLMNFSTIPGQPRISRINLAAKKRKTKKELICKKKSVFFVAMISTRASNVTKEKLAAKKLKN
ncbi:hypothetical protein HUU42_09300 [bacterium]|nr:hypothetical protein [bacterium]